jgi:CRISPR-associated endonuclease/helicase Cas3
MSLRERFDAFFRAVNGGAVPYPWQHRLVERVASTGRWPAAITAPTGSGKSSVIDAHVFLVAEHAVGNVAARPPRRLVLVAPRRVLVDDQHERACRLAERLGELLDDDRATSADERVAREVAEALAGLVTALGDNGEPDRRPLLVTRLRGGAVLDTEWRLDPARCQVICATPQMWGSRLLFRGFRATRRSRNHETGLLANDVAVVIDEAHLHERLVETARRISSMGSGETALQVVAMSATRPVDDGLGLAADDLADESLARRVRASKAVEITTVDDWRKATAAIVDVARVLRDGIGEGDGRPCTVGVFVNTVARALEVADRLERVGTTAVVCGRMRPADLANLKADHPGLLGPEGSGQVDFLVTTQSLEVGVDLDLPGMVTELAPASALAQRAGRLNRSGRWPEATLHVVAPADPASLKEQEALPYDPAQLAAALDWLRTLDGDASPERISASTLPAPPRVPLPAIGTVELDTAAMTNEPLAADLDVDLYINEPDGVETPSVWVGARAHLDLPREVVAPMLLAAPPRAHELASFGLRRARGRWVPSPALATVLERAPKGYPEKHPRAWVLRWVNGVQSAIPVEPAQDGDGRKADDHEELGLRPGDVVVLAAGSPVCTGTIIGLPGGRRAADGKPIDDVMAKRPGELPPDVVVRLDQEHVSRIAELAETDPGLARRTTRDELASLVGDVDEAAAERLRGRIRDVEVTFHPAETGETGALVLRDTTRAGIVPRSAVVETKDEDGDGRVLLDRHQEAVEARMRRILDAIGVDDLGAEPDRLLQAARWHDEGKRAPRFQQRMGNVDGGAPVAKPLPGHLADRGDGWRHEQLSAAYAAARSGRDPLVTVLVAAHHGLGRPLFDRDERSLVDGWDDCPPEVKEEVARLFGPAGRYELEREAVDRQLGTHRLAYLEALLRCADTQVSREGS